VFDLGGGTFDVSILDIGGGVVEVRATSGDTHLGGDDFDRRIVDYLADEFHRDNGIDLRQDPQALQRLFEAAEKAKVELSAVTQTTISLPFVTADANGPKHLNTTLTRAKFDQLTADLVERTAGPVRQAIADARRWTCCPGWATRAGTTWGPASIRLATTRWPPYPQPVRRRGPWSRWSTLPMARVTASCARRRW